MRTSQSLTLKTARKTRIRITAMIIISHLLIDLSSELRLQLLLLPTERLEETMMICLSLHQRMKHQRRTLMLWISLVFQMKLPRSRKDCLA